MTIPSGVVSAANLNAEFSAVYNDLVTNGQNTIQWNFLASFNTPATAAFAYITPPDDILLQAVDLTYTDGSTGNTFTVNVYDPTGATVYSQATTSASTSTTSVRTDLRSAPIVLVKGETYTITVGTTSSNARQSAASLTGRTYRRTA